MLPNIKTKIISKNEMKNLLRIKNLNLNNEEKNLSKDKLNDMFYFINSGIKYDINNFNFNNEFKSSMNPENKINLVINNLNNDFSFDNLLINKDDILLILELDIDYLVNHDHFEDFVKISIELLKNGLVVQHSIFFNCLSFLFKSCEKILFKRDFNKIRFFKDFFNILKHFLNQAQQYIDLIITAIINLYKIISVKYFYLENDLLIIIIKFYIFVFNIITTIINLNENIITTNNYISTEIDYGQFMLILIYNYNMRSIINQNQIKLDFINIINTINKIIRKKNIDLSFTNNFCILDLYEINFYYCYYNKKNINIDVYFNILNKCKSFIFDTKFILRKVLRLNKFIVNLIKKKEDIEKLFLIIEDYYQLYTVKENHLLTFIGSIVNILNDLLLNNSIYIKDNKKNLMILLNYLYHFNSKKKNLLIDKLINLIN